MTYAISIQAPDLLDEFRDAASRLLAAGAAPADVVWNTQSLFHQELPPGRRITLVSRAFATLAAAVACHRDEHRWPLLYEALWRIDQGETALMEQVSDDLVHRLTRMATAVKHDQHRMTAFVRFRNIPDDGGDHFIAWYEPRHRIVRRAAAFFVDRFASIRFSILTPDLTLHWDREVQTFAPGLCQEGAVQQDAVEDWWRRYYTAIFNPGRINPRLMQQHMPKTFWHNLPEARSMLDLIREARARTDEMITRGV